jgi:hypothetical protein
VSKSHCLKKNNTQQILLLFVVNAVLLFDCFCCVGRGMAAELTWDDVKRLAKRRRSAATRTLFQLCVYRALARSLRKKQKAMHAIPASIPERQDVPQADLLSPVQSPLLSPTQSPWHPSILPEDTPPTFMQHQMEFDASDMYQLDPPLFSGVVVGSLYDYRTVQLPDAQPDVFANAFSNAFAAVELPPAQILDTVVNHQPITKQKYSSIPNPDLGTFTFERLCHVIGALDSLIPSEPETELRRSEDISRQILRTRTAFEEWGNCWGQELHSDYKACAIEQYKKFVLWFKTDKQLGRDYRDYFRNLN